MKRYSLTALLVFATLGNLMAQKSITATSAENDNGVKAGAYIYSLPQTHILFKVQVARQSYKSGPFAQYSQKYMGIPNALSSDKKVYTITSISANTYESADASKTFVLNVEDPNNMSFLELTNQGLIVPTAFAAQLPQNETASAANEMPLFTDLSINPSIYKENATFFSDVKMDTAFVKVPVQKSLMVEKSNEAKAQDAANFIYNLRKRRLDLISGDIDNVFNNGEALKAALSEINRLENEYLSLFIGKVTTDTATIYIEATPSPEKGNSSSIIFRFNEGKGIMAQDDLAGRPILLEVESNNTLSGLQERLSDKPKNYMFVRYPETCKIKISDGKETLFKTNVALSQFGKVVQMPLVLPSAKKK